MGAERIALVQELGALAVGEAVSGQQMLGHVGVEAGAEDAEVPFGRKRQRGDDAGPGGRPASPRAEPPPPSSSRLRR